MYKPAVGGYGSLIFINAVARKTRAMDMPFTAAVFAWAAVCAPADEPLIFTASMLTVDIMSHIILLN